MTDKQIRKYLIMAISQECNNNNDYYSYESIADYILKHFNLEFKDKNSKRKLDNNY